MGMRYYGTFNSRSTDNRCSNLDMVMQPQMTPTTLERARELDVAARIARDQQDYVFALTLEQHAELLRIQAQQEEENATV